MKSTRDNNRDDGGRKPPRRKPSSRKQAPRKDRGSRASTPRQDRGSRTPGRKEPKKEGWVRRKSVWRSGKTGSEHRADKETRLAAVAKSSLGPGGYLKFSDIPAHKLGRSLRGRLYKLAGSLGPEESQNLVSRIKYAATTVTASLATGFGEGTFRSGIGKALESRGALFAIQDHLQHLSDESLMEESDYKELKTEVNGVVAAVNEYLGMLVKENEKQGKRPPERS